jgi:glycosyltransferase involved in cell wall biosynthesis
MTDTTPAKQLHIVYVWDADYPWDVRAEKSCLALTEAGHDVHIVARNRKRSPTVEKLPEATVHRMPPWHWAGRKLDAALGFPAFFNPRWRALIANTARAVHADVIIARDLPLCPTAISVGHKLGIPVVLDMAEHYPAMIRAIWQTGRHRPLDWLVRNPAAVERVERYCVRHVDHILTVADEMTERLVSLGAERSHITRVSNTPSVVRTTPHVAGPRGDGERIQLVYLGLMELVRGICDVIDAVALLRNARPRVVLLLIGSGRDAQLFRDRVKACGLTDDDVIFLGHVPYAQAIEVVANADIGVLPLHRNAHMDTTLPNKVFDYMSVGLPVITSDTIPSARLVEAEDAGVVFVAQNARSLADAIIALADPVTRREMGAHGRAAVERQYHWENDAARLINAVTNVRIRQK